MCRRRMRRERTDPVGGLTPGALSRAAALRQAWVSKKRLPKRERKALLILIGLFCDDPFSLEDALKESLKAPEQITSNDEKTIL